MVVGLMARVQHMLLLAEVDHTAEGIGYLLVVELELLELVVVMEQPYL
jgi:hypothetical protein